MKWRGGCDDTEDKCLVLKWKKGITHNDNIKGSVEGDLERRL